MAILAQLISWQWRSNLQLLLVKINLKAKTICNNSWINKVKQSLAENKINKLIKVRKMLQLPTILILKMSSLGETSPMLGQWKRRITVNYTWRNKLLLPKKINTKVGVIINKSRLEIKISLQSSPLLFKNIKFREVKSNSTVHLIIKILSTMKRTLIDYFSSTKALKINM